jgi:hypothetical protein
MAHILSFLAGGQLALMRRVSRDVRAHVDYEFQRRRLLGRIYRPAIATAMTSPSLLKDYMRYSASVRRAGGACLWDMDEKWCLLLWDPKNGYRCKHVYVYRHAIRDGNIAMLEWLFSQGRINPCAAFQLTAELGKMAVVEWLTDHYHPLRSYCPSNIMWFATRSRNVDTVEHFVARGMSVHASGCEYIGNHIYVIVMPILHRGERAAWSCSHSPCDWARAHRSDALSEQ